MKKQLLMTRFRNRVQKTLKSRGGQSTTEYILILAIVVMIASKLKTTLSTKVVGAVETLDFSKVMDPNQP